MFLICKIIHSSASRVILSLQCLKHNIMQLLEVSSADVTRLRAQLNERYNYLQKKI